MKRRHLILNLILCAALLCATGCTAPFDSGNGDQSSSPGDSSWQMPSNGSSKPNGSGATGGNSGSQNDNSDPADNNTGTTDDTGALRLTPEEDKFAVFSQNGSSRFQASRWSNGGMFNCTFSTQNAVVTGGILNLSVTKSASGYLGGEYQSYDRYSYGYYSVSMKAASCSGVVSSFFTYTNNRDEIDIEFLGKDTTKVQFNYFVKGVGGHEYLYELGFDASKEFHEYGFDWQRGSITWYVDGKAVYSVYGDMPNTEMKIMMNAWNGIGVDDWLGPLDESRLPATGQYQWVGYSAA